ncbi:MAG: TIGR00730 family Rossman fold protein [Planctomycetota bacterium]
MKSICVFCGANPGNDSSYTTAARALGERLAARGIDLVYGGGSVGMMGAVADAVLGAGGRVHGVIPRGLATKEIAHQSLTRQEIVPNMHARKARMAELAEGFIALPGGFGTLEELFEVITWAQLGIHRKPVGLLNVLDYYAPLITMIDDAVAKGFIRPEYRQLLLAADVDDELIDRMVAYEAPRLQQWMTSEES